MSEIFEHGISSFDLNYICLNCKNTNKDTVKFNLIFKKKEILNVVWQTTCGVCYKKTYKCISMGIHIENVEVIDVFNNANLLGDHLN